MSRLPLWFRSVTQVSFDYEDPYEAQRARGLLAIAVTAVAVVILVILALPFYSVDPTRAVAIVALLVVLAGVFLSVPLLINRGQLIFASLVYILILFLAILIPYISSPNDAELVAFASPIIAAGVLLNRRGMVVMLGLVLLSVILTWALIVLNALPRPIPLVSQPGVALGTILPALFLDGVMLIVFAGGQRTLQRRSITLAQELRNSVNITQTIAEIHSADELLTRTVELIRENLNYYHVRVFLLEETTHLLVLHSGTTFSGSGENGVGQISASEKSAFQRRITPDEETVFNEVIRSGQTLRITSADSPARRSEMLGAMRAQLLLPLRRESRTLGVLDVQSLSQDAFDEQDVEVLRGIASQLAIALENTRLYSQLQATADERQKLAEQLRHAAEQIEQLSLEVGGRAWTRYLEGRAESVIGFDWKQGMTVSQIGLTPGLERALNSAMPELYVDGAEQVLCVPIISRGQNLGAMEFRAPAERVWNSRSIELVRVISQRLALALDNLRLFEQAQTVANREQVASQIAANLQTKTDVDSLVAIAAEAFQEALGATRTSIRLGAPGQSTYQAPQTHQNSGKNGSHS